MLLCYVDECGNTGRKLDDPAQPLHTVAAVIVPEDQALYLAGAMEGLRAGASAVAGVSITEFKARELFGGGGPWKGVPVAVRNVMFASALSMLEQSGCEVAHATIDKQKLAAKYRNPESPHLLALQFLLERIDDYCGTQTDPLRQRALIVADETKEHGDYAIELVAGMIRAGSPYGSRKHLLNIVDTIHFVRSHDNGGVQLADLVAYVLNRRARLGARPAANGGEAFTLKLWEDHVADRIRKYRLWP